MTKTIKLYDDRFYEIDENKYYPSVTTILHVLPKGPALMKWVGEHGNDWSNRLKTIAAEKGSIVHSAIEDMIDGRELHLSGYEEDEWRYLISFMNFWKDFQPETVEKEHQITSHKYEYAGTLDWAGTLIHKKTRKFCRIDWKTSNAFYKEYALQLAAYEMAEREAGKQNADILLVIRFGTKTKRGYSVHEVKLDDLEHHFKGFLLCRDMYNYMNPHAKPSNKTIPTTLSINSITK